MEYAGRTKKRSLTEAKHLGASTGQLLSLKLAKLKSFRLENHNNITPIYTPGPKPSNLLLEYVNKKQQTKLPRIAEIKKTLHLYSSSLPYLICKSHKAQINSYKPLAKY